MARHESEPAIRVLPADDNATALPPNLNPRPRWLLPVTVLLGLLAVFVVVTRPTDTTAAPTTTRVPPIAALDARNLDLRTATDDMLEWESAPVDNAAQIHDLERAGGIYVAGGSVPRGAQVWWAGSATTWQKVPTVRPVGKSSIDHIVSWDGDMVALGSVDDSVGIWTSQRPTEAWHYRGLLGPDPQNAIGLVAGPQLLTITGGGAGWTGWTSADGVEWSRHDTLTGLDTALLLGLATDGTAYYAYGAATTAGLTHGAIYRSADGTDWRLVGIDDAVDAIDDLAVDGDRLVALGKTTTQDAPLEPALWESTDGANWSRLGDREPHLDETSVSFSVTTTNPGDNPSAVLVVNNTPEQVTVGTTIETDVGTFKVDSISSSGIDIEGDPRPDTYVGIDEPVILRGMFLPSRIAAEGARMAIIGSTGGTAATELWLTDDGGVNWSRKTLPGTYPDSLAIDTHGDALVATASGDETETWRGRWDTDPTAAAAEDQVRAYLEALAGHDAGALVDLLPGRVSPLHAPFEVPSLAHEDQGWWDDQGNLVTDRVAGTIDYLAGTNASIAVDGCTTAVSLGSSDRVDVSCAYTVNSDLLSLFAGSDGQGGLRAVIRDGVLSSATVDVDPSVAMWEAFGPRIEGGVTFTAASAQQHLDAARHYLDRLLQPGETATVPTVLGDMEWSWLEPDGFDTVTQPSVVWSKLGFVLNGYTTTTSGESGPVLFTSGDGVDWEQSPLPDEVGNMWGVSAFRDGIVANQWTEVGLGMVYFDGDQWTHIDIPAQDPANSAFSSVAGNDRILVFVATFNRYEAGGSTALYMIDPDFHVTVGVTPPPLTIEAGVQFEATDDGFVAFVNDPATGATSMWSTRDGQSWTLVTESVALDNVAFSGNALRDRDRYFVVGQSLELNCTDESAGAQCDYGLSVWTSDDGTVWRQLHTADDRIVAASDISVGPLGLAAFGFDSNQGQPASVYLSADGNVWSEVEDIALFGRTDGWWWTTTPAVGTDTVVVVGTSYKQDVSLGGAATYPITDGSARLFMIVGRVVDG